MPYQQGKICKQLSSFVGFYWLDNLVHYRPTRRNTPGTRSCPGSSTRMGMFWHVASLSFAANPVRSHREWAGVIDRITLPEPAAPKGSASPRVGALIQCLHRDFTSPNGQGRYALLSFDKYNLNPSPLCTASSAFHAAHHCSHCIPLICLSETWLGSVVSRVFRCFAQPDTVQM